MLRRLRFPMLIRTYGTPTVDDPSRPLLDGATVLVLERAEGSLDQPIDRAGERRPVRPDRAVAVPGQQDRTPVRFAGKRYTGASKQWKGVVSKNRCSGPAAGTTGGAPHRAARPFCLTSALPGACLSPARVLLALCRPAVSGRSAASP
ncbi:hypothetical protein [Streptomyces heilongjiangensis]|uniref:Uncharacterized protein n=1 Tax=Streptomyces heilongjiangensis TaxID=945052 RepID=A0ABW1B8V7_9ACTN|nr:hypothetical protein [Streptomyces heilongjiangensis]MDC2947178.1 hypothetical protein [Streptomyces heilongjiangensis]